MLDHLGMQEKAARVRRAIRGVLEAGSDRVTPDLGGKGSTDAFADALIAHLRSH